MDLSSILSQPEVEYDDPASSDEVVVVVDQPATQHHQPAPAPAPAQPLPTKPAAAAAAAAAGAAKPSSTASKKKQQQPSSLALVPSVPNDHLDPGWINDPDALKQEEDAAFELHPDIVLPYLARVAASTTAARNAGIQRFSHHCTTSLVQTANDAVQWAGSALTELIHDEVSKESREREAAARQLEQTQEADRREAQENAVREERLQRKREAAREGWKKRRVNREEKQQLAALAADSSAILAPDHVEAYSDEQGTANLAMPTEQKKNNGMGLDGLLNPAGPPDELQHAQDGSNGFADPEEAKGATAADITMQSLNGIHDGDSSTTLHPPNGDGPVEPTQSRHLSPSASRKRAASASSSASINGSTANGKRARLIPSTTDPFSTSAIKQEATEPLLPADLTSASAPSSHVHPSAASSSHLPHLMSSPAPPAFSPSIPGEQADVDAHHTPGGPSSSTRGAASRPPRGMHADYERKVWATLARSNVPKVIRAQQQGLVSRQIFHKRLAGAASREAKKYNGKHLKPVKDVQIKARRVMREMLLHLKGSEKTQRETKRKADKEVLEKAKREEEVQEAQRAARKLNFLITQTELYSHFVGSKLGTAEAEESEETFGSSTKNKNGHPGAPPEAGLISQLASASGTHGELSALDFNDADESNMLSHARRNAEAAAMLAKNKAKKFDETFKNEQASSKENYILPDEDDEGTPNPGDAAMDSLTAKANSGQMGAINIDDMNFQNPTMAPGMEVVQQPAMLTCSLKEYQLKGLNWLANLYEQGINGILADEMGLGKTVQSISLMAYLAEQHNIWGPFLVVAPASTLHNWQQEITRFAPALKVLPYWGNVKDRTTLRKFWNRKSLRYDRNAPFHVLVTSYQLVVTDEQYFNKVKWQYMILDEAQAIKSSSSSRWKILLGMNCRNRLLLTGTPIQNSMHELWALLHFIMPSLFDSHNEFSDWFAKDIEGNADKNGTMNEHQLRRLHMILKPFMLRRIKKNVQNELAEKIEIDVYCDLTTRQRHMYRTLRQNISITDLVARAASLSDDDSVKRLMNLIMQFRKVCNHPELFERADVTAPFTFSNFNQSFGLNREGNQLTVQYSSNPYLDIHLPRLLYDESPAAKLKETGHVAQLMNIWSKDRITSSIHDNSTFSFTKLAELDPNTVHTLARSRDPVERLSIARNAVEQDKVALMRKDISGTSSRLPSAKVRRQVPDDPNWRYLGLPPLGAVQEEYRQFSRFNRSDIRFYIGEASAPPAALSCSSREFAYRQHDMLYDQSTRTALYGVPGEAEGIVGALDKSQLPLAPMEVPQLHKLILDSGKLAKLDELLVQLKAGGHRVLVYFQMTRMIDLMEEYLAFRQYKYLRLDGSSSISERRDMVSDWQTKPELFIFLLSTRAGGLGINLTAADTVIFYDSDWNPSNDAQAMDRAHRLGQTRQVTVYRLITKNTIDERILQLARTKKSVQDAVVGSSTQVVGGTVSASGDVKSNEVVSLLLDDDELAESLKQSEAKRQKLEMKRIDNGQRGAKAREDNKKAKEIAAAAKKQAQVNGGGSMLGPGQGWGAQDDDEDAFGFFSAGNGKAKAGEGDDDMDAEGEDDLDGGSGPGGTAAPAGSQQKGRGKAKGGKAKATADDPDAPQKKKRAPNRKPPELGPDGQPIKKARKSRAKKADMPEENVPQSADASGAPTPMEY